MPETDVIGHFLSVLLNRAAITLGDLDVGREDWWIEFRPTWPDIVRLRYLTPHRENRRWVEWRIPVNSVLTLEAEGQLEYFIDRHLHQFKERVLEATPRPPAS